MGISGGPEKPVNEGYAPQKHTFRDRDAMSELGHPNGHVSSRTYVPRAYYRGGGQLVRDRAVNVDGPPRPATVSCDSTMGEIRTTGSVYGAQLQKVGGQGRVRQPPYKDPRYNLRPRTKAKELGPHMQYKVNTETERINESVSRQGVGFSLDEFEPHASFGQSAMSNSGGWRNMAPNKWKAGPMALTNAPQQGVGDYLNGVSGKPYGTNLANGMEYAEAQREIIRDQDRAREMGDIWMGTLPQGKFEEAQRGIQKRLQQSVNPTHSRKTGMPLPATASRHNPWSDKRAFGQSIRSVPSQILS